LLLIKGYRLSPYATADGTPLSPIPEPIVFRVTGNKWNIREKLIF